MILNYQEHGISRIYLMLGSSCNFKCKYCIQTDSCINNTNAMSKDTIDYIWHLIKIRPSYKNKLNIMLWGGEPLLYWNIIVSVVNEFKDNVTYSMVTNGSLLTKEKVEFINKYNINIALSNDGINTKDTRNINILDNDKIKDLFMSINNKEICAVISGYNYNYQELLDYFHNKIGDVHVNIENLKVTWDMPQDIYNINIDKYKEHIHKLAEIAYKDILNMNMSREVMIFLPYLNRIANYQNTTPITCGQMYFSMNIDLSGNIYNCHNSSIPIGTVKDNRLYLLEQQDKWIRDNMPVNCKNCRYFLLCKGGCPNELIKNNERYSCSYLKVFYEQVYWIANMLENQFETVDLEV